MKQLTKICWHLTYSPIPPYFSGEVGLNLAALGLVRRVAVVGDLHAVGWGEGP